MFYKKLQEIILYITLYFLRFKQDATKSCPIITITISEERREEKLRKIHTPLPPRLYIFRHIHLKLEAVFFKPSLFALKIQRHCLQQK